MDWNGLKAQLSSSDLNYSGLSLFEKKLVEWKD